MMNTKKSTVACALNMVQLLRWMAQQQQQGFCSTQVAVRMSRHVRTAQRTLTQLLDEGMVRFSDAERDRRWYPQPVLCELFAGGLSSGADAGDDPGHVHICAACFDPQQHDVAVLQQQRDELIAALRRWIWLRDTPAGFVGKYGKALREAVDEREAQLSEAEAISRAAIAKARGAV